MDERHPHSVPKRRPLSPDVLEVLELELLEPEPLEPSLPPANVSEPAAVVLNDWTPLT
jgi:hypothetical protein